jgi:formylglycine-generating enzyme required for sulfatase activity
MTTLVMRYEDGVSPFGVYDMSGNVWEWCVNTKLDYENPLDIATNDKRAVQGGSFVGVYQRAQISFYYYLDPQAHYQSIGFRIVNNGRKKD